MKKEYVCAAAAAAVIVLSCALTAFRYFTGGNERYAYVYSDSVLIKTIDLNAVKEPYSFLVETKDGGSNTVEVCHGEIGVTHASCPDEICINTGFIHSSLLPIVCLPNKLVVEIKDSPYESEGIDAVAQ